MNIGHRCVQALLVVLGALGALTTQLAAQELSLTNLSCRAIVGEGNESFIGGFVLHDEHRILIRGVGPGLSSLGVSNFCRDPRLSLYRGDVAIGANDDWPNDVATRAAFAEAGAFALQSGSKDAAMLLRLPPGAYTATITTAPGSRGIALLELYDLDASPSGLANLSVRGMTIPGEETLTPGVSIVGLGRSTFLWRLVGPTLESFGISGFLPDPKLTIRTRTRTRPDQFAIVVDGKVGLSASNLYFASVGAFPLREPPLDVTYGMGLDKRGTAEVPAIYTASAESVSNSSGVVLFELYVVPNPIPGVVGPTGH